MDVSLARRHAQCLLFHWLPMVLWMVLIYWLSSQPTVPHPGRKLGLPDDLVAYVAHASMFGVLALLVWRVLADSPHRPRASRIPFLSSGTLLLSALYALSDELHQLSTPGRTASLSDWLADMVGIAIALALLIRAKQAGQH